MVGVIVGLAVVGVIVYVVGQAIKGSKPPLKRSTSGPVGEVSPKRETASQEDPTPLLDGLARLNLSVREAGLSQDIIRVVETVIDRLREMLPVLNSRFAGKDLTWTANQLARVYLPEKTVYPFLNLPLANQRAKESEVLETLNVLDNELGRIAGLVERDQVAEFDTAAAFMKARFLSV